MHPQPLQIEVIPVTAAQVGVAFLVWVGLISAAFWLGVLAGAWGRRDPSRGTVQVDADGDDPDDTVEIRPRRRRPPHTGTVHEPRQPAVPADDATVVIRLPDEVSR